MSTAEDLLAMIPEAASIADITARAHASVNSWNMTPAMMLELCRSAQQELARDDVAGVVITHGTDTVEESAMLAWMLNASVKPIVFVAAMRNLSEAGPDGARNLLDAVRVATSNAAREFGSLLVINETIHSARYVTKMHTVNPSTFASPHGGPVGEVTARGVECLYTPITRRTVTPKNLDARVPLVKTYTGMDSSVLDWYVNRGIDGIVIEGSGAGNVPGEILPAIERVVATGVPAVLTTRCPGGPLAPIYGTGGASGGGHDLIAAGMTPASRCTAQKARIALLALLGEGMSPDDIREWFASA
jgi:L-asparaginase